MVEWRGEDVEYDMSLASTKKKILLKNFRVLLLVVS